LSGYFSKNCENIDAEGKDKTTVCPKNKFWTGIKRTRGKGLDEIQYQCCEADYHEPLTGDKPLPDSFKTAKGTYVFKIEKGFKFLRMNNA